MKNDDKILFAGVANHAYLPGALATFSSILLSSSRKEDIEFHLFSDGFTEEDKTALNTLCYRCGAKRPVCFHTIDIDLIKKYCVPYKGSYMAWVRLFFSSFLDYDWVVYADMDTLWFKDIAELWAMRDENVPIHWAQDLKRTASSQLKEKLTWDPEFDKTKYCNSGVLLMNLSYMRKDCIVDRVKDFLGRYGSPAYVDQDVLNHLYNKTAVIIDSTWNCVLPNRTARNGAVLHCFGIGRMFSGSMRGWDAFNGIWYEYYSKCVLARKSNPCGFLRRLWWNAYGFFFPCERFLRILTFPLASYRAEQLAFMQFRAWVYVHRKWGRK